MKLKAVGYRRVSTDEQAESGHSLDAQQRAIETFVQQRGWQLGNIYTDAGLSGQSDQRPALNQLLQGAAAGQFEVVVVHSIDRFYRSLTGLITAMELLRQHHVSFVSINENLDFTTPWGKLTLAVLGTLAEIYIDKLSAETKKGKLERARKGLFNGSIPFGYCTGLCSNCTDPNGPGYCPHVGEADRSNGEVLVTHPIERVGVRRAFKLSAGGLYTDREIAEELNKRSVRYQGQDYTLRPKRRPGDVQRFGQPVFQKDNVREMLTRVFYTGVVPYFGINEEGQKLKRHQAVALYPGQHPALVSQELFDKVQATRRLRRSAPVPPGKTHRHYVYPLSGLLFCGECGQPMRAVGNAQGQRYYRCATRIERIDQCHQPTVLASVIEEQIAQELQSYTVVADWQDRLTQAIISQTNKQSEYADLQQRLARARELYLEGDLSRTEYEQERSIYLSKFGYLTNIRSTDSISVILILKNFSQLWQADDDCTLKRKLLRSLLGAATIRGYALHGWLPNSALYPLLRHGCLEKLEVLCHSGSDGDCSVGDTQPLEVTLPDSDQAPVFSPIQVVLELGLCTPDDLWEA